MAAGLGFKDFTTGEVLTAADVDGYLMQGVWVFASATARDAAVTSPQEGNFAYLKDTNVTTYYTGSAWANLDTTGMTNPMTTTGDTIYSSSGSTPARLGIGTAGQILRVNSGATAPEWATPAAGGGMTLLSTTTLSGATVTISTISQDYLSLFAVITGVTNATADGAFQCAPNGNTGVTSTINTDSVVTPALASYAVNYIRLSQDNDKPDRTSADNCLTLRIDNYTTSTYKPFQVYGYYNVSGNIYDRGYFGMGGIALTTGITSLVFNNTGGNLSTGTVLLYGVK